MGGVGTEVRYNKLRWIQNRKENDDLKKKKSRSIQKEELSG